MTRQIAEISCVFTGGPLDGQRISVPGDLGSYYHEETGEVHVYHRRSHPSALLPPDKERTLIPSPPIFDHQPQLTKSRPEVPHAH